MSCGPAKHTVALNRSCGRVWTSRITPRRKNRWLMGSTQRYCRSKSMNDTMQERKTVKGYTNKKSTRRLSKLGYGNLWFLETEERFLPCLPNCSYQRDIAFSQQDRQDQSEPSIIRPTWVNVKRVTLRARGRWQHPLAVDCLTHLLTWLGVLGSLLLAGDFDLIYCRETDTFCTALDYFSYPLFLIHTGTNYTAGETLTMLQVTIELCHWEWWTWKSRCWSSQSF